MRQASSPLLAILAAASMSIAPVHGQNTTGFFDQQSVLRNNGQWEPNGALPREWFDWLRQRPMAWSPNGGVKNSYPSWNGFHFVTWTLQAGNGSHGPNWYMSNFPVAVQNYTAGEYAAIERALRSYSNVCGLVFDYRGVNNGFGYRTPPPSKESPNGADWHWSPQRLPSVTNRQNFFGRGVRGFDDPASLMVRIQNARDPNNSGMMAPGTLGSGLYRTGQPNPRFQDFTIRDFRGQRFIEVRMSYTANTVPAAGINGWDVDTRNRNYHPGSWGHHILVHELGHAFGLDHMNRRSPRASTGAPIFPGLEQAGSATGGVSDALYTTTPGRFGLNNIAASIMSYRWRSVTNQRTGANVLTPNRSSEGTAEQGNLGFPKTPMAFDIINLQMFYGINRYHNRGNTVYRLPAANDPELGWECIWDAGGINTIAAPHGDRGGVEIDLRNANLRESSTAAAGTYSRVKNVTGGFTIAYDWDGRTPGDDEDGINAGINIIERAIGGEGADTFYANRLPNRLVGGGGNDVYYIKNPRDRVVETAGNGTDTVYSPLTYRLPPNVENLVLTGSGNTDGTGNTLNNRINGNSGNNVLRTTGGTRNVLRGGRGNDTYYIASPQDVVEENFGEGTDKIFITTQFPAHSPNQSYQLPRNVEEIEVLGNRNINIVGNVDNNVIIGNNGTNHLQGGSGNDVLDGGRGNDILEGGTGRDVLFGGPGANRLSGGLDVDRFVFRGVADPGGQTDHGFNVADEITDFSRAQGDKIALVRSGWDTTDKSGDRPVFAAVTITANLQDALLTRVLIIHDRQTGNLHYNRNGTLQGSGINNNAPFARVSPGQVLIAGDFILID